MKRSKYVSVAILTLGLVGGSIGAVSADTTASPKPTVAKTVNPAVAQYQADLAAYKIALQQYRVDLVKNEIAYRPALKAYWAAWISTNQAFNASWQATWATFKTANDAYQAKYKPLNVVKDAALNAADSAFLASIAADTSTTGIEAALKAHTAATTAAQAAFKAAVTALGPEPVRPVKPADPVKPAAPTKPTPPVKPVAPVKPAVVAKATPTK
ncbi:MAG: hypothetical protein WCH42_07495 [Actinomycetes bacterium]